MYGFIMAARFLLESYLFYTIIKLIQLSVLCFLSSEALMPKYTTDSEKLALEVETEFYKSSGPGGQHKNKRETAVRLFHPPSGITVTCSDERSQSANREIALQRLSDRLKKLNRPRKRRIRTKPTRASQEKRLQQKKLKSRKKRLRRFRGDE